MRAKDEGFALVEAIAALALAAIAAAGLMATLGAAGMRTAEIKIRSAALQQAQAVLAEVLAATDLKTIARRGELKRSDLSWIVSITEPGAPYPGIQEVDVTVRWTIAGKKGETRLAAYRVAPPEAAS